MPSKRDRRKKAIDESSALTAQDIANDAYSFLDEVQQEKRIQLAQDGEMTLLGVRMTRTGITFGEEVSEDDYREIGRFLLQIGSSIQWLIGDWLAFGEDRDRCCPGGTARPIPPPSGPRRRGCAGGYGYDACGGGSAVSCPWAGP